MNENNNHHRISILVADDHENILSLFKDIFRETGYNVFLASNGQEALEVARKHEINVAFIDVKMPVVDGLQALVEWKKIQPDTQIVMISAYSDDHLVQKAIREGAHVYLFKPINIMDILSTTVTCLKRLGFDETISF